MSEPSTDASPKHKGPWTLWQSAKVLKSLQRQRSEQDHGADKRELRDRGSYISGKVAINRMQ